MAAGRKINRTGRMMEGKMKRQLLALCLSLGSAAACFATESLPPDVSAFINNAEECQHFAGEWDSDLSAARQKEVEKAIELTCGKAREEKEALQIKYKGNKQVEERLADYAF